MAIKNYRTQIALPAIAAGSLPAIWRTVHQGKTDKNFWPRLGLSFLVSGLAEPFRIYERLRYNKTVAAKKIEHAPVFILGHWRSGTTYLHNLICKDPQMAYVTTYHGTFPEIVLSQLGKLIFKNFMRFALPSKRQGDNVQMDADFPQEEEFGLANIHAYSFYNFWYFPLESKNFYDFIDFKNVDNEVLSIWQNTYIQLIKKALINTQGNIFASKNPVNTGRIPQLLKLFPNAKFIHIYRNPYNVFLSARKFIKAMIPSLQFQNISDAQIETHITQTYTQLMQQYFADKALVSANNLIEVRFEDFEKQPVNTMQKVYEHLQLPNFKTALPHFNKYVKVQKKYQKNKHQISAKQAALVANNWQFALDKWQYQFPDNLIIKQF